MSSARSQNPSRIIDRQLERIHYIHVPEHVTEAEIADALRKTPEWKKLDVDMHVLDVKGLVKPPKSFFEMVGVFSRSIAPRRFVTLNVAEELYLDIVKRKMESAFNRVHLFPDDLYDKKKMAPLEIRRLLVRYLIGAAYAAVEVALHSTVSCDENYVIKAESVPYSNFDLISVIDVKNDFLRAQFRLCASEVVLHKAADAMLGGQTKIDEEMIESMASELLNLIYGKAKSNLNDKEGFRLPAAIPKVLKRHQFGTLTRSTSSEQLVVLPLVTPLGSFYLEIDTGLPA